MSWGGAVQWYADAQTAARVIQSFPPRLALATHNRGKAAELRWLLQQAGLACETADAGQLGLPTPVEHETSYIGNALIKARACAALTNLPALADDAGMEIAAWQDRPGLETARFAQSHGGFAPAMQAILDGLQTDANRQARFVSALALVWPHGRSLTALGVMHGTLAPAARGEHGFGFDPIFIPNGCHRTYGEMPANERDAINHRAVAFRQLLGHIATHLP